MANYGNNLSSVTLLELFAAAAPAGLIAFRFQRRQEITIEIKPAAFLLLKARSLMNLADVIRLVASHKFHDADRIGGLPLFRLQHREAEPGRILHAFCEGSAIAQCPLQRMVGSGQIVHLALAIGRIARSHQCFSCRGDRLAKQIWLAAGIKRALAAARTVGSQHSGREGTDINKL